MLFAQDLLAALLAFYLMQPTCSYSTLTRKPLASSRAHVHAHQRTSPHAAVSRLIWQYGTRQGKSASMPWYALAPNPKPYTLNLKPETRNPKPETRNPKPESRKPKRSKVTWVSE